MLLPRKNRIALDKDQEAATFPTITVTISDNGGAAESHEVAILDINNAGIGIICNVQLCVGQQIFFTNGHAEWDFPQSGTVMWTFSNNDGIRAGIKFA